MWGMDADIVPIIVGGLGAITKNFGDKLTETPGHPDHYLPPGPPHPGPPEEGGPEFSTYLDTSDDSGRHTGPDPSSP